MNDDLQFILIWLGGMLGIYIFLFGLFYSMQLSNENECERLQKVNPNIFDEWKLGDLFIYWYSCYEIENDTIKYYWKEGAIGDFEK